MKMPDLVALSNYNVNRRDEGEGFWQPLYDYQTYALAGQTSLRFFAIPRGQGGKTLADTNMSSAGVLPTPIQELVTGIQIVLYPGINPGRTGDFANTGDYWNDIKAVAESGFLEFTIGSKVYCTDAPLNAFPPAFRLSGAAALADATTAAAALHSQIDYASFAGPTYAINPGIRLISNQNFDVTLSWPTAVALPSGVDARIGVRLLGWQYRLSQ